MPPAQAEYRVEIYNPPYIFMTEQKPTIISTSSTTMSYTATFGIVYNFAAGWSGNQLTHVVLVAPSSATHSYNTHQRVVGLQIVSNAVSGGNGVATVRAPPNINIAPPGMYMLFILNGDVYSRAVWVQLLRPAGAGSPGWMP